MKKDLKPTSGYFNATMKDTGKTAKIDVKNLKVSTVKDNDIDAWYGSFEYDMKFHHHASDSPTFTFDNDGKTYSGIIYKMLSYPGDKRCEVLFMGIGKLYEADKFEGKKYNTDGVVISVGKYSTLDITYNDGTTETIETKKWILRKYNDDIWHGGLDYKIDISKVYSAIITCYNVDNVYCKGRVLLTSDRNEYGPIGDRPGIIFQGVEKIKEMRT